MTARTLARAGGEPARNDSGARAGVEEGGRLVIAAGTHVNFPGTTNLIKVDVL